MPLMCYKPPIIYVFNSRKRVCRINKTDQAGWALAFENWCCPGTAPPPETYSFGFILLYLLIYTLLFWTIMPNDNSIES